MSEATLLARLALIGFTGDVRPEVLRIFCLYCCRAIDSDVAKAWFRTVVGPEEAKELLEIKYSLDDSADSNNLWRALHELSQYKRPLKKTVIQVAHDNDVDADDLAALLSSLSRQDRDTIVTLRAFLRAAYSEAEINYVMSHLNHHFQATVYKKLQYVANNDYARDHSEMVAELKAHAIRLIRRYEIEAESYDHMVKLVARGVQNHATNLAIRSNRKSRQILTRLVERPPSRSAWWFDTRSLTIRPVEVESKAKRKVTKKKLACQVRLASDGTLRYAQVDYLFENKHEAMKAQFKYRRRKNSSRRVILDLTPPIKNDFVPTTTSLSRPVGKDDSNNRMTLADVIPSPVNNIDEMIDASFITRLNQDADDVVRRFIECFFGQNRFFLDHLEAKGLDHSKLGDRQLCREICWYLGVKLDDVKEGLRNVPQRVWSNDEARKIIYHEEESEDKETSHG